MKKTLLYTAMFSLLAFAACNKEDEVRPSSSSGLVNTTYVDQNYSGHGGGNGGCNNNTSLNDNDAASLMIASFSVENENGKLDEKADLLLSNKSINAVTYEWDFGNGDKSTEVAPSYSYDIHGNYTIKLKTTDARGNTKTVSQDVVVLCIFGGGSHEF